MSSPTPDFNKTILCALLAGIVAFSAPAVALEKPAKPGVSRAAATSLTAEPTRTRKKPSMVQVKNVKTGEVGCHDYVNQVSTPGPCKWPSH